MPWDWPASIFWDGNDGLWNSFIVRIGTPAQYFRVLPSILEQAVWVPHPQGCNEDDPADCPYTRGTLPFEGRNSTGLQVNESTTWELIGIYTLSSYGESLGYTGNGQFGFDTVALSNSSDALELEQQVVAAIADKSFYLGQFGLGPKPSNFSNFNDPIPNYMTNLVNQSKISSMSFGYTAGAYYRDKAAASLTLGGYDENRFEPAKLSFKMHPDNARPLQVGVQKILADNTLRGTVNLLPTRTFHLIDSTVPHIWLPEDAIAEFVSAFGLTYDNATDLYLVNGTMHDELLLKQPIVTFVLAENEQEGVGTTQNIELPYAAFDLQAGYPFYETNTRYFPIRRAANNTQYTIGRAFLQEAYVVVDWERQNFTVAQARFDKLDEKNLVPILASTNQSNPNRTSPNGETSEQKSASLGTGTVAGIVVGIVVLLALAAMATFFYFRKSKYQKVADSKPDETHVTSSVHKSPLQQPEFELDARNVRSELGHGDSFRAEAPGHGTDGRYELSSGELHQS